MKEEKLTGRGKARLIARYLRPVAGFFALGLLFSLFSQVFNALIPQIVRVTVDSVLGPDEPQLPGALKSLLPIEALRSEPGQALAWAAAAVAAFAVFFSSSSLSGVTLTFTVGLFFIRYPQISEFTHSIS